MPASTIGQVSGGPPVGAQGHLVGINAIVAGPDIGPAVPVRVVHRFLRDLLSA